MAGLVVEGGAFRTCYANGVFDALLEENIMFPYIIGVSAGISNAYSYVSRQKRRNWEILKKYRRDKRYTSLKNFRTQKSLFGLDFIYDEIPNRLIPFDYQTFSQYSGKIIAGVTDAKTGNACYYDQSYSDPTFQLLRATCALPVLFPAISFQNQYCYDGGLSDPIPIRKSIADGNQKNLIILSREAGYQKQPLSGLSKAAAFRLKKRYPEIARQMATRHTLYNQTLRYIQTLETAGQAVVLRPPAKFNVGRMEKNIDRLFQLYQTGIADAKAAMPAIKQLFNR